MEVVAVIDSFRNDLKAFVLRRVKDADAAEDIVQDTLLKVLDNYDKLNEKEKLTAWLYKIAHNTMMDYYRQNKRQLQGENLMAVEETADESLNHELVACIHPFVAALPDKYRDALLKTDLGNLSQKEYAQQLGISYSGAKSNVQRARQKLRELFVACCRIETDKYGQVMEYTPNNTNCICQ